MFREDVLFFNNKEYFVRIYLEKRNSTYLSIGRKINIRIPKFLSENKREEQIELMKKKIISYLEKNENKYAPLLSRVYFSGEVLSIYGTEYILKIVREQRKNNFAKLNDKEILLKLPVTLLNEKMTISKLLSKVLSKNFLPLIKTRVDFYNLQYFKKDLKSISLRNNTSKFASCSHDHKLVFSISLLFAPKDIVDYVIVHELVHTIHHNHSPAFWKEVEKYVPNHKEKSKWLRENRAKLIV